MTYNPFDLTIIGGGNGGYVAAIAAAQRGLSVALVESDRLGGVCLHRGCIPTKSLLYSARMRAMCAEAEGYGIGIGSVEIHYDQMLKRTERIVNQLERGLKTLMLRHKIQVFAGRGCVTSGHTVEVEAADGSTQQLRSSNVLVATGSRPMPLADLPFAPPRILSSDDALALPSLPQSAIIVGAGPVGVEFASLYNDLGVQVTLVEAKQRVLTRADAEVSQAMLASLRKRGVAVHLGCTVAAKHVRSTVDGCHLELPDGQRADAEVLLLALGRRGSDDASWRPVSLLQRDADNFIVVDENYRTSEPSVYAVGDAIGGPLLAHKAAHEGRLAVQAITGGAIEALDPFRVGFCVYGRPEAAGVGLTEEEARARGHQVQVGRFPWKANGRALIRGETEGFVKLIIDGDSQDVLGLHVVGPEASELVSEGAIAQFLDATPWELAQIVHPHPSLSEAIGEAALDAAYLAIHL